MPNQPPVYFATPVTDHNLALPADAYLRTPSLLLSPSSARTAQLVSLAFTRPHNHKRVPRHPEWVHRNPSVTTARPGTAPINAPVTCSTLTAAVVAPLAGCATLAAISNDVGDGPTSRPSCSAAFEDDTGRHSSQIYSRLP